jgi:hypothetical protein
MLKGRYSGNRGIPDYSVSLENGPVTIAIEIGVSQPFEDLEKCAEKWLIGKRVQLVILLDIDVDIHEVQLPFDSFSSTHELEGSAQSRLPYNLEIGDLRDGDFETIGLKILQWYASQEPPNQLVQPRSVTIYLYRHHKEDNSRINQDHKAVFFDCDNEFTDAKVHITSKDFGIPSSTMSKKVRLPLEDLKAKFFSILAEYAKSIAEHRAEELLEECGLGTKKDPDYKPSPEVVGNPAFPPFQPTKPSTRSSGPPKHAAEDPVEPTASNQKKRKRKTTRTRETDQSFGFGQNQSFESTSSGIFPFESDEESQDQVHSMETSFSGPSAAIRGQITGHQSSALTDPESSGGEISRRRSKRGKAKRT